METKLLKGSMVAKEITARLIEETKELKEEGIVPRLAIVRIGENPDDIAYEKGIEKRFEKIGLEIEKFILDVDSSQEDVLNTIEKINLDKNIHGALLFRPFPKKFDDNLIRNPLTIEKDLDGISDISLASIFTNTNLAYPPCTAKACIELLNYYKYDLEGMNVVVVGRSLVIGKPVSMLALNKNASVTICHSRTKNIEDICKKADIVIAAVGKANFIGKDHVSENQVFVDVGINVNEEGNLVGDINFDEVEPLAKSISPVPGGVGSITTSILASHLVEACKKSKED